MSKEKKLIKNTLIFAIGNFSTKFLTFLLLPFYTYYLTTSDYGFVDLVSTTISFFIPIISFQIMDGCYRYLIVTEDEEERSKVISNSFIIVLKNILFANLVYIILNMFIDLKYSFLILIQFNAAILSAFVQQSIRGLKKNYVYSIAGIISTLCMLSSNIILIAVLGLRAEGLMISTTIAYIITFIYIIVSTKFLRYIKFRYNDKALSKELISYSVPLIPNYVNWWIMNVSDRIIINLFIGISGNGIYAIANKFPQIIQMMCNMFNMAWQESAILEYDKEERDTFYSQIFNNYAKILLSSMILMLSITRILFNIGINEKFADAYIYIPFLYFGVVFSTFASFYGTGYQSSKNTKGAFRSSILGSIMNILVNILLVQYIGLMAASISTMMAFLTMWIYRIFDTRKYFNIKVEWKKFIALMLLTIVYIIIYYVNDNIIISSVSILGAIVTWCLFNKEIILQILNKAIKRR